MERSILQENVLVQNNYSALITKKAFYVRKSRANTLTMEALILSSNIQYLTSIDSSATKMCTVITVLDRCLKIKVQLRLNYIVCVFDQAIYCKAMLKWRYPDKYKDCILMLGIFHMIMMYLGIIGKKFSDAGLKDLIIQSDVVAMGQLIRH